MPEMKVNLVTPEKSLFDGQASFLVVPAAEGEIGFLYSHAPIMSSLGKGEVRIEQGEDKQVVRYAVSGGFIGGDGHRVIILATRGECLRDRDPVSVKARITELQGVLKAKAEDTADRGYLEDELAWMQLLEKLL